VDFEEPTREIQPNLLRFMQELHAAFPAARLGRRAGGSFRRRGMELSRIRAATDYLMLMAYDEHWAGKTAGSVASQDWFEGTLANRMHELTPAKTIIALGNYGYDWTEGGSVKEVSFQEAVIDAKDSEAQIEWDAGSRNPHYEYDEQDESHHAVWFLDGVTAFNQMRPPVVTTGGICSVAARLGGSIHLVNLWHEAPNPPVEALRKIF